MPPKPVPSSQQWNGVSPELFRRQRLWAQLAAYRPLGVLAAIWLGLLAIAFLAYGQLLHTTTDAQDAEAPAEVEVYPHERLRGQTTDGEDTPAPEQLAAGQAPDTPAATAPERIQKSPASGDIGISGWTLVALVGTCALGSWVLSVQLKSPPKARKKKIKLAKIPPQKQRVQPPNAGPGMAQAPSKMAGSPKRLAPYDPNQPLVKATAQRQPVPGSPGPASPPQPQPAATDTPSDVTVVSEGFQHRLDWPEDSLVNTADVRQRRSLSSFM